MITQATLCPWPPLLVRELTGADPVLPELRAACAEAVGALLSDGPDEVAVVGPGTVTAPWPGHGRLNVAAFGGPRTGSPAGGRPVLPPAPGIGAYLLDQAGYGGERLIWSVSADEPVAGLPEAGRGPGRARRPYRAAGDRRRQRPAGATGPGPL